MSTTMGQVFLEIGSKSSYKNYQSIDDLFESWISGLYVPQYLIGVVNRSLHPLFLTNKD